jgi:hypothetical protein
MKLPRRTLGAPVLALGLAALLGFEGAGALARRFPSEAAATSRSGPAFGAHQEREIEIVLDSQGEIDLRRGGAALRFRLENHFHGAAVARYAVEWVDDLGDEIERPFESAVLRIPKAGSAGFEVELPSRLAEGFYLCRISAAGLAGPLDSDHLLEVGLAVEGGVARILDTEEWLSHSRANQGV